MTLIKNIFSDIEDADDAQFDRLKKYHEEKERKSKLDSLLNTKKK